MELDQLAAAGALVQPVDVLRDQHEIGGASFQFRQREVARVGLRRRDELAAPGVPVPDELRVARECGRRGELARIEARPQAGLRVAERRQSGFGGDARTGQRRDKARVAKCNDELGIDHVERSIGIRILARCHQCRRGGSTFGA